MLSREDDAAKTAFYYVLTAAGTSAITATTLGYDVGIMADAAEGIKTHFSIDDATNELIIGSLNFVSAFGALLGGPMADRVGRKPTVLLCCILYLIGTVLMAGAPSWQVLLLGRIITGLGVGVSFTVCPVYVSEIAPAELRGRLTTLFDISINVGILVGYVVGYVCEEAISNSEAKWRTMLGLGLVPPLMVCLCLALLPESPRYLVMRGKMRKAVEVLTLTLGSEERAREECESIRYALHGESKPATPDEDSGGHAPASWSDILMPRTRLMQRALFIVLGLSFWQQATGSEAVLYYSATFLEKAGLQSKSQRLLGNMGLGVCKLIPEAVSLIYVDKLGRVKPLILSAVAMTVLIFLIGFAYVQDWSGMTVVFLLCGFMLSFSIAIGPFTWVVVSEVLPLQMRAKGTMLGIFLNRLTSGTVALTALSTADSLGPSTFFFLYTAVSAISIMFYWRCVPETAGKSLEETEAMLAEMPPLDYCPCHPDGKCCGAPWLRCLSLRPDPSRPVPTRPVSDLASSPGETLLYRLLTRIGGSASRRRFQSRYHTLDAEEDTTFE